MSHYLLCIRGCKMPVAVSLLLWSKNLSLTCMEVKAYETFSGLSLISEAHIFHQCFWQRRHLLFILLCKPNIIEVIEQSDILWEVQTSQIILKGKPESFIAIEQNSKGTLLTTPWMQAIFDPFHWLEWKENIYQINRICYRL